MEEGEGARLVERRLAREHGLRLVVLGRERLELIGGHLQQPHLHVAQRACRVLLGLLATVRGELREARHRPETHRLLCPPVHAPGHGHAQGHAQGEG